ncbi:FMN-binding protein [Cellulomonas sp. P24]|uniref:FMN-binding protein n=1 Tax=Cellulomonas sp. P24 TaxID=2885206 RepID=UPI00216AF948|nr:FMN-binding protein [Cellulomonas sp. P24]MCR6492576.1 FMN-binding protein [Cellulomonas sp. P24]
MRRIIIALASTVTAVVMLFSWPTSTNRSVSTGPGGTSGTGTTGGTSSGTGSSGTTTTTYDGDVASTRWGDVQVRITVTDGKVTASEAIAYPNGNGRDQQINAYAIPILNQEAVAAQSANISMVSGATVTSQGYVQSLQSALDKAGI